MSRMPKSTDGHVSNDLDQDPSSNSDNSNTFKENVPLETNISVDEKTRQPKEGQYAAEFWESICEQAIEFAISAGNIAVEGQNRGWETLSTKSNARDVVTEIDREVEQYLKTSVGMIRPEDTFFGEESGHTVGKKTETALEWIVDPIDGTVNFLYNIPNWAVSIAVAHQGQIMVGVVHNPNTGEIWHAIKGEGAWKVWVGEPEETRQLKASGASKLSSSLVATGFAYDQAVRKKQAGVATHVLAAVRDIRRMGAASLDGCAVAEGRVEAYYEQNLNIWDYAAAALISEEAGAAVDQIGKVPASEGGTLVISAQGVRQELIDLITENTDEGILSTIWNQLTHWRKLS